MAGVKGSKWFQSLSLFTMGRGLKEGVVCCLRSTSIVALFVVRDHLASALPTHLPPFGSQHISYLSTR